MLYYVQYIFYGVPILALVFFCVSLVRYISAKRKNKRQPESVGAKELQRRKLLLIISSVIVGVFVFAIVGLIVLLHTAVAFM